MNNDPQNPLSNQLGAGLNEAQVLGAVQRSGYPLQTIVGDALRSAFSVQEEWCYVDRDTKELRTIDIHASRMLFDFDFASQPRVRPQLDLIVECKQSQLPYVFFLSPGAHVSLNFPEIAGLRKKTLEINTDDDLSRWSYHVSHALGLNNDVFHKAPRYCNSFGKCVRKGTELELSGSEAYSGLVLPLVKGIQHLIVTEQPVETAFYFDAHLTLAVGVLDAPMIGVSVEGRATSLILLPWVRVLRHEYLEDGDKRQKNNLWVIDIVHKDFFEPYLNNHVLPFSARYSERVLRHPKELATGEGFVQGMGKESWYDIEARLMPRPATAAVGRTKLFFRNLIRLVRGRI
jgi:hypothetical protein